jgi:iron complex outermembrane receptor protein
MMISKAYMRWLAGTALGALAASTPAFAQESESPRPSATDAQSVPHEGIADIIVTANRRAENNQKVATAVTAINADTLREQNIGTVSDLLGRVPSLNVAANGSQRDAETITIRGQGQTYLAPTGVVNYFSEVPLIQGSIIGSQGGPGTLFDLESLQVLRGPQGTLFGRNTTGGALLLGPKKPTGKLEGWVSAQVGNYDDREFEAVVNVPIVSDVLAIRAAYKRVDRDGYTKDVGTSDATVSLPFQTPFFGPIVRPNAGQVLPGNGPNTGNLGLPGTGNLSPDFRGRDYDDRHYWTARLGVLLRPVDGIENYLVGYYSKGHNNGTGQVLTSIADNHPTLINLIANAYGNSFAPGNAAAFNATDPRIAAAVLGRQQALGPRHVSLNTDQFYRIKTWSVVDTFSAEITDGLVFRNIFGYQRLKQNYAWDLDGSYLPVLSQIPGSVTPATAARFSTLTAGARANVTDVSLLTEESQLQGTFLDGKFTFVVGGYYSKQKPEGLQATGSYNGAAYSGGGFFSITTKSKAAYAQGSLDLGTIAPILDGLKVTGGIRQTVDEYSGSRISVNYVLLPLAKADDRFRATTWTVGLDYQLDRTLLFGKITRGYKAGGFNYAGVRPSGLTFDPEYVTSYELGAKTDFRVAGVPVRFNVSAYQLNYSNIQRANGDNVANGCPNAANPFCNTTGLDQGAQTYNIGKARVRGIELETTARLFPGFELSGSYSYTKAKYLDYLLNFPPDPLTGPQVGVKQTCNGPVTIPRGVTAPDTLVDLTCSPFPFTPENQFSVNARYAIELADAGAIVLSGSYSHADPTWTAPASLPRGEPGGYIDAYDVFSASVDWNGMFGTSIDARAFVTNLTNQTYRISNSNGVDASLGYSTSIYSEPRMYGLQIRYRFGD